LVLKINCEIVERLLPVLKVVRVFVHGQMCGTSFPSDRRARLADADQSVLVAAGYEKFNCFFAFSGSGTSSAAGFVFGADESRQPTQTCPGPRDQSL
jgi:hypothetical protein